jgi:ABC-type multidrug transport system ATPase subunit
MYAAYLRLQETMTQFEKEQQVIRVLGMLELTSHADTIVGSSENRGLSGGQIKRLSIAVEIIHLPDLIFADEPTVSIECHNSLVYFNVIVL